MIHVVAASSALKELFFPTRCLPLLAPSGGPDWRGRFPAREVRESFSLALPPSVLHGVKDATRPTVTS